MHSVSFALPPTGWVQVHNKLVTFAVKILSLHPLSSNVVLPSKLPTINTSLDSVALTPTSEDVVPASVTWLLRRWWCSDPPQRRASPPCVVTVLG